MNECYDCKKVGNVIDCPYLGNTVPSCRQCWREKEIMTGTIYSVCDCAGCEDGSKWEEDDGEEE